MKRSESRNQLGVGEWLLSPNTSQTGVVILTIQYTLSRHMPMNTDVYFLRFPWLVWNQLEWLPKISQADERYWAFAFVLTLWWDHCHVAAVPKTFSVQILWGARSSRGILISVWGEKPTPSLKTPTGKHEEALKGKKAETEITYIAMRNAKDYIITTTGSMAIHQDNFTHPLKRWIDSSSLYTSCWLRTTTNSRTNHITEKHHSILSSMSRVTATRRGKSILSGRPYCYPGSVHLW